tara:strand:- start:246 stop:554 length:309 start_codon:yes stop_codon:yes gene_type:complete
MKKILISVGLLFLISSSPNNGTVIFCKPEIKYCIYNLKVLKKWLNYDYKEGKIPSYVYEEYLFVLNNTSLSLEMILENKGQCDTTQKQPAKFVYKIKSDEKI